MHPQWLIVVRRIMVSGLLLMLALAGIAPDARAASFIRVTPTGASTWPCGDTWATACDLQTALTNAASGDEIWVAAGTYTPTSAADRTASFQLKSGVAIYGGFVMTETLRDQRDWATSVVTLSGDLLGNDGPNFANNSENSYHVVTGATGATLDGVTITGGNANGASPNFNGGGMINNNSSPTLTHVIFQSNTASNAGGGLDNFGSHPTLTHVTFSGNIARFGGGVDNFFSNPTLVNITFAGNGAAQYGGGIYNEVSRPTLTHVTFSGNMAASGGALYNALSSQAQVANSILWGDSGGEVFNSTGVTLTLSTSVVQGGCPAGNSYCSGLITNNPLLGILGEYGGGLPTLPLLPGSPAIGVTNANCPTADARGVPRPQGSACDLGAFESRTFTFAPGGGDNQTTAIYRNFSQPLSVTVSSVYSDPVDGGQVLFRSPISGPGLTSLVYTTTIASGVASQIVMANGSVGSYVVTVSAVGATTGSGSATIPFTMTNVDNPVLHVIPGGLSDGWCDTWITACELRYALSSSGAGQEIWVAAGTYTPADFTPRTATFQLKAGVAIYGGFAATETLRDQRNWVAHVVTLSGDLFGNDGPNFANNSENSYHVVTGATDATLDGVTIAGGNANASVNPDWNGGGMINNSSSPTLTHVIFRGNASANVGGGMLNSISSPRLTDVLFIGNSGRNYGGGMYNAFNSNLVLINVTFFGNHASQWGGGYYGGGLYNEGSSPTLNHVTLSGNSGGGISNYYSHPQIVNSILWGDSGSEIYNDTGGGATISASVVQGGCSAGSTCSNLITDDPLLGALGNYGDGLPTLPLLPGSSAIDATNANCPGTDARGVTRPQVNACDLGAFESQGFTLAKTGGDGQSTPTNLDFLQPLSVTVTSVYSEPVNGGQVRLSAPSSGASLSTTAFTLTIASGVFSTNVTANGIVGTYPVTASAAGAVSVTFALTNTVTPIRYAVPGGLNSGPCDSWITACELRYALSTSGVGNEIWIKEGTYIPTTGADRTATFQLKAGLAIYGGFGGNETTRNQRDWVTHVVTLSGDLLGNDGPNFVNNGENSYHVVTGATGAILDGVTISSGNANGSSPHDGGGGLLNSGSSPTLTHIILRGNAASQAGGGLFSSGSSPALSNLTFISNTAQTGGGMFNESSDPILSNVTFAGNTAVNGGAVYSTIASRPTLTHVTISGNTASSGNGGGLYNADSAHPQIINSIVWGDGGSEVYNDTTTAASVAITASVVRDGCPAGSSDCSGLIANDPLLSLLGDYGGGLPTLPLLPGSSAIDATNVDCPATDERGVTRPQGNACDLGAFESRGFILTKAGGDNQAVPIDAALPLPLNVTLREAGGSGLPGAIITFTAPAIGASIVAAAGRDQGDRCGRCRLFHSHRQRNRWRLFDYSQNR